jgi:hypothetical protein
MRDLYVQLGNDARCLCPSALVEKAYRAADRVSILAKAGPLQRSALPGTVPEAIAELEALIRWCDALTGTAAA